MSTHSLSGSTEDFNPQIIPPALVYSDTAGMARKESFADRLRAFKTRMDLSLEAIGRMAGWVSAQAVHKWLRGGKIEDENLQALARASGLPEAWWRYGINESPASVVPLTHVNSLSHSPSTFSIPLLDVGGSMGAGRIQPELETIVGTIDINQSWVRTRLPQITSPTNLRVITGYGDSMESTFSDGDILFIDVGVRDIRVDAVYVFSLNGELFVKRVQRRADAALTILSDNKKYEPQIVVPSQKVRLEVQGRVVWAWSGHKL